MLSRTADCLFWLGRYTERAANVARGLNVAWRMAGLGTGDARGDEWRRLLIATGCEPGFTARHGVKRLVWYEQHETMPAAIAREKALKHWRREWKIRLIEEGNPGWRDLWGEIAGG